MDPTSLMTFPSPVVLTHPLFDREVYLKADGFQGPTPCRASIDSVDGSEQGGSLLATNWIFFILNEHVRRPLREIPDFPKVAEHPDGATIQKVDQIFQRFLSEGPLALGTGDARAYRIDIWKRVNNILQTYFKVEVPYLMRHLMRTRGMSAKETGAFLSGKIPGSLADAIGATVLREASEETDMGLREIAVAAYEKGMTLPAFRAMLQAGALELHKSRNFFPTDK